MSENLARRHFLKSSSLFAGLFSKNGLGAFSFLLGQSACVTRGSTMAKPSVSQFEPPTKSLLSPEGFPIRYHMRQNLDQNMAGLLIVYSHVYSIMNSAVPASQAETLGVTVTPGKLKQFLPEVSRENWELFTWWSQAEIHFNHCAHGDENFVFWHRPFIFYFEKIVRTIAQGIVIQSETQKSGSELEPLRAHREFYLNWTLPVFHWNSDETLPEMFFDENVFAPYPDNTDIGTGNTRQINASSKPNPVDSPWAAFLDVSQKTIDQILSLQDIVSFAGTENFTSLLEGAPHGGIHVWVGAQMNAFFSPLDPIFWIHHGMIDYLFEEWMIRRRNEGMKSADFLPGTLARGEQSGFFDIETGKSATMKNNFMIELENHRITYDELSPRLNPEPDELKLDSGDAQNARRSVTLSGPRVVTIDAFRSHFFEFEETLKGQNFRVLRTKLQVAESAEKVDAATELLEEISRDARSLNKSLISSVQLRFEKLSLALRDKATSTLQIKIRKQGYAPFLESNYAIFERFSSQVSESKRKAVMEKSLKKRPENMHHHGSSEVGEDSGHGFMIDLLPVIVGAAEPLRFRELLTSETFWADFRMSERASFGRYESKMIAPNESDRMEQHVKISLVVQTRSRV